MYIWLTHFESESHSIVSDSLRPLGLYSPWNSPGQNTGVGSLSLLQGIFPTQGWNPGLPHCRQILHQLSHQGSPNKAEKGFKNKTKKQEQICSLGLTPTDFRVFLLLKRLPSPLPCPLRLGGARGGSGPCRDLQLRLLGLQELSRWCPWGSDPESALGPLAPRLCSLLWEPGLLRHPGGTGRQSQALLGAGTVKPDVGTWRNRPELHQPSHTCSFADLELLWRSHWL